MDLEKIREAFERWVDSAYNVPKDEFKAINADTHASTVNGYFVPFYAGYKAALSIIDPDEIRRECEGDKRSLAEKLRNYLPHCGKQDMTNGDRELVEWVEEIMGNDIG